MLHFFFSFSLSSLQSVVCKSYCEDMRTLILKGTKWQTCFWYCKETLRKHLLNFYKADVNTCFGINTDPSTGENFSICKFINYGVFNNYFVFALVKLFFFQGKQIANSASINSVLSDICPFLVFHSRSCWCKIQRCQLSCMRAVRQISTPALTRLLLGQDWELLCWKMKLSWYAYGKRATGTTWGFVLWGDLVPKTTVSKIYSHYSL